MLNLVTLLLQTHVAPDLGGNVTTPATAAKESADGSGRSTFGSKYVQ